MTSLVLLSAFATIVFGLAIYALAQAHRDDFNRWGE